MATSFCVKPFQHTAARRRLGASKISTYKLNPFQHTAARRRLDGQRHRPYPRGRVSTHSRPKAAGADCRAAAGNGCCFNTQPPEGGWDFSPKIKNGRDMFQHTAARRRLATRPCTLICATTVSTHSRPKAAGVRIYRFRRDDQVSTHSRPKAAGSTSILSVSSSRRFNTQPPEGGWRADRRDKMQGTAVSTHSRPKAAGLPLDEFDGWLSVSTHSRPKAAGESGAPQKIFVFVSTHSRPKAAGDVRNVPFVLVGVSTHSRPKAAG